MRINANKKVHKRKRDPFELLARTAGVLVVALVVGIGVFYLCTLAITNDYNATRDAIAQQNEEAEVEFNAKMNALRENANAALDPDTGELTAKDNQYWEAELGGSSWRVVDESTSGLENAPPSSMAGCSWSMPGIPCPRIFPRMGSSAWA